MLRPQEQGAGGGVCAQTRAPLGWAVPPPWRRLSACADRPWLGVLPVGWGLRTWGRGRLWAWRAGARGGCQWPMGVRWRHHAGRAVSWRPLPGPAGPCSALEKQRSAAWPPASRCLPPDTAVAVRSSSSFPESWGLRTGSGCWRLSFRHFQSEIGKVAAVSAVKTQILTLVLCPSKGLSWLMACSLNSCGCRVPVCSGIPSFHLSLHTVVSCLDP